MNEALRDKERLLLIVEAIDNVYEFTAGKNLTDFEQDKMLRYAVIKNFEIIGEAAFLLSKVFKSQYRHIEWADIIEMRNVLVEGNYKIKGEIVWATIETKLFPLKEKIVDIIEWME